MVVMNTKATHFCFIALITAMVVAGMVAYPHLPGQVASHWNAAGESDGYTGKFWGTFLLPMVLAGIYLLYAAIPKTDPLKANIQSFRPAYNLFFIGMAGFFIYLFALSLSWTLGLRFDF